MDGPHLSPDTFLRLRAEAAVEGRWLALRPALGAGATLTGVTPAVFALASLAVDITPRWAVGLEVRGGELWSESRTGRNPHPMLEGRLHVTFPAF
jgi:hypothetical protein